MKLKDCEVGNRVKVNGDKGTIKEKTLESVKIRFDGNDHLSKWYDTKECEVIDDRASNTKKDNNLS